MAAPAAFLQEDRLTATVSLSSGECPWPVPPSEAGDRCPCPRRAGCCSDGPRGQCAQSLPLSGPPSCERGSRCALCPAGGLQEPAGAQEQGVEELGQTLHLEEVVPESAGEWQALANVF